MLGWFRALMTFECVSICLSVGHDLTMICESSDHCYYLRIPCNCYMQHHIFKNLLQCPKCSWRSPKFIYYSPKYSQMTHYSSPMRTRYEVFLWVHGLVYNMYLSLTWHFISMAQCKTAVSPLLTYWRYCSLALSHRYVIDNEGVSNTEIEIRMIK